MCYFHCLNSIYKNKIMALLEIFVFCNIMFWSKSSYFKEYYRQFIIHEGKFNQSRKVIILIILDYQLYRYLQIIVIVNDKPIVYFQTMSDFLRCHLHIHTVIKNNIISNSGIFYFTKFPKFLIIRYE